MILSNILKRIVPPIGLLLVIFVGWQLVEDRINEKRILAGETSLEFFVPTPLTVLRTGVENFSPIAEAMAETLQKAFVGFLAGTLFAVLVAIVYSLLPSVRTVTFPIAFALQSFPIVGLAPVIVLAFGQDTFISVAIISAILAYFPILLTLDSAFTNVHKEYLELSRLYNANELQTLRYFKFPLATPQFLTSLKLAAPASIVGATIAEWMGSSNGIGRMITLALYQLKPGILYACLVVLAAVSASTVLLISLVEWQCFYWIRLTRHQQ